MRLQSSHGNRHVQRVVAAARAGATAASPSTPAGAGPVVGPAGDRFEREADRTADRVVRSLGRPAGGRHPAPGPGAAARPEVGSAGGRAGAALGADLAATRGRGAALPGDARSVMESALGRSFSGVRVHTDSPLAGRVAATAFTHGHDIHFAPGAFRPHDRSGAWLLAHELTHVVQQSGSGPRPVRRHSSREHYILGSMSPGHLKLLADGKADAKDRMESAVARAVDRRKHFPLEGNPRKRFKRNERQDIAIARYRDADMHQALDALNVQIAALRRWSRATMDNPDPAHVEPGDTGFNHEWGGQLVTVTCHGGERLVCTVGDLNALPDFFGSFEDLSRVSRVILFRTLQAIRRESLVYLYRLHAEVFGETPEEGRGAGDWSGLAGRNVNLANPHVPDMVNNALDVLQTEEMLTGEEGERGLPESIGASATLGRNACHFPPESWLRWRQYHEEARELITSATNVGELGLRAHRAVAMNAFGEHYLQDSFAGGHMINKGFVMAEAMRYLAPATKASWGVNRALIAEFTRATAHSAAYRLPQVARQKWRQQERGFPAQVPLQGWDDPGVSRPRDPQSALERARAPLGQLGLTGVEEYGRRAAFGEVGMRQRLEVEHSGLDPAVVGFDLFRTWLNDLWLQKVTNTLHDEFCEKGLEVTSPARPDVFRIYGDANMMRSAYGAEAAAEMSSMSRTAINDLIRNRAAELQGRGRRRGGVPQALVRVPSVEEIFRHFPDHVRHEDVLVSLEEWATGEPMRQIIRRMLSVAGKDYSKVTGAVGLVSVAKQVSAGLTPAHSPAGPADPF